MRLFGFSDEFYNVAIVNLVQEHYLFMVRLLSLQLKSFQNTLYLHSLKMFYNFFVRIYVFYVNDMNNVG